MIIVIDNASDMAKELLHRISDLKEDKSVKVYEEDDILEAFCRNEASFRLNEYFGIAPENQTEDLICDVKDKIKNIIDNHAMLYDDIDCAISKLLHERDEY